MSKTIWSLTAAVVFMFILWMSLTVFFYYRVYTEANRTNALVAAQSGMLVSVLGQYDNIVEPEIPYTYPGGQTPVLTFSQPEPNCTLYVTCGVSSPPGKPNALGPYELAICVNPRSYWPGPVLQNLSIFAKNTPINPGDTFSLQGLTDLSPEATSLLFVRYKAINVDGKPGQILLGVAVTPTELTFAQKHGPEALVQKLIDNGIYPVSYLHRGSLIDPSSPLAPALEGRRLRKERELNSPEKQKQSGWR